MRVAALIPAAALVVAACMAAAPHAHADGGRAAVEIAAGAASPTALRDVPFGMTFDRPVDSSTLDASDVEASSGKVRDLRAARQLAFFPGPAPGEGRFGSPAGVAVDGSTGAIYVADRNGHRVHAFDRKYTLTSPPPPAATWPPGRARAPRKLRLA